MEKSPSIANLAKALKEFHSKIGKIPKEATNPFFNSKYATLSAILEAIKQPMLDVNLTFTQFPCGQNGLVTILMHTETGEYMQSEYFMQPIKNDPQAQGSVISYMRRYGIAAMLGLNLEDEAPAKAGNKSNKANNDIDKPWLDLDTPAYNEAVEHLQTGRLTINDLYNDFKISKPVRAMLAEALSQTNPHATKEEKPWLDMNSKKWELVTERLRNKTTTLSQVAQYFKLNKEVRAELQSIINEAGTGTPMQDGQ